MSARRWLAWGLVALIVASGGWLRWAHHEIDYRYPDEAIASAVVGRMRQTGDWDTNWIKSEVPPEMRQDQYNFSSYHYALFFTYRAAKAVPVLAGWRSQADGFVLYRFFSVACAIAALLMTLVLARAAGGTWAALLAGLAAAGAVLLVQDAHYVRPESFMTLLLLAGVALAWPTARRTLPRLLVAGGLMGLLLACKVSLVLVCWVPLVAAWRHGAIMGRRLGSVIAVAGAIALGFALGAPGAVLQPAKFLHGVEYLARQYARGHPPHGHMSGAQVGDLQWEYLVATVGWATLLLAAAGAVSLWRRRQGEALMFLALPPLVLAGYFGTQAVFFERNLSPVLPLLLVLSGVGGATIVERVATPWRWVAGLGLAALVAIVPLRLSWPLVTQELSVLGPEARSAFDDELRARFPASRWLDEPLVGLGDRTKLRAHFAVSTQPVLLRAADYHDEWSAEHRRQLEREFVVERVAEHQSTFGQLPVCTLLTYHSARSTYYRITGWRGKP